MSPSRVVKILQASKQIVQGVSYTFRVALKRNGADVICVFKVWEQEWIMNGRDVDVNCNNQNTYKLTQNPVSMRNNQRYCTAKS